MNLSATVDIYAGGPGSGCNPEKGKCGRPKGSSKKDTVVFYHATDLANVLSIKKHGIRPGLDKRVHFEAHPHAATHWAASTNGRILVVEVPKEFAKKYVSYSYTDGLGSYRSKVVIPGKYVTEIVPLRLGVADSLERKYGDRQKSHFYREWKENLSRNYEDWV